MYILYFDVEKDVLVAFDKACLANNETRPDVVKRMLDKILSLEEI